jgi:23S rRNA (adenine-N6)-dimethyltransferase
VAGKRPRRDARRRVYSQNFLADQAVAERIVRAANVSSGELVVEIGAGDGMLTRALARTGARVHAVEIDAAWAARLQHAMRPFPNVRVIQEDARRTVFPETPFRVVANLPFGVTTDLLHRLLDDPLCRLERADLLVQWEVARKRAGRPRTRVSASWSPWWRFRLGARIPRGAFRPRPAVGPWWSNAGDHRWSPRPSTPTSQPSSTRSSPAGSHPSSMHARGRLSTRLTGWRRRRQTDRCL